jgi:hypothetical protein
MPQRCRRRHGLPPDRRRAPELLAASHDGCTESLTIAHGFTVEQVCALLGWRARRPNVSSLGGRTVEVARVKITRAGRQALVEENG